MSDQTDDTKPDEVDPDAPVTIKLRKSIEAGSETITEFTLRPIAGKDMRFRVTEEKRPGMGAMWRLGRLSGHRQDVTDKLSGSDLKAVLKVVNDFLADSQETGDEPSDT